MQAFFHQENLGSTFQNNVASTAGHTAQLSSEAKKFPRMHTTEYWAYSE